MKSIVWQIVEHTLQNPKSKQWSRKNLTSFTCLIYSMVYATGLISKDGEVHEFVVAIFVGAALTCLGISTWEKANVEPTNQFTQTTTTQITEKADEAS